MTSHSSTMIIEYAKSTQNVCMCLSVTIFFIILFMMTPLNTFLLSSIFGKVIILTLLGYTLYYNIYSTNKFANTFDVSLTTDSWSTIKTNIVCSYIFSLFLVVLLVSLIRKMF